MSKHIFLTVIAALMLCMKITAQGTLTAYYAKVAFKNYKKGALIVDSNDPINRIVNKNATYYKYEGDDTGEYYSWLLPKAKVEKRTYQMSQLPVSMIGDRIVFVSNRGYRAEIFKSNINGHRYYNWDGSEYNASATKSHQQCYVLSANMPAYDGEGTYLFEDPLYVDQGNIRLYIKNRFAVGESKTSCRYRANKIGMIEEEWYNPEAYGFGKSAYDNIGNLKTDQYESDGIPDYLSIAYIADLDALYINGALYYRQK